MTKEEMKTLYKTSKLFKHYVDGMCERLNTTFDDLLEDVVVKAYAEKIGGDSDAGRKRKNKRT